MTALKSDVNTNKTNTKNLFKDYPWFYLNIYEKVQKSVDEFFQKDIKLRFFGVSTDENILMYGDEYFVNQIPVSKNSVVKVKISSNLVSSILDVVLGGSDTPFQLKNLTDIEAMLLKSFTVFIYKHIEAPFIKAELNKKVLESSKDYNITFYVKCNSKHCGKIIITIPDYMFPDIEISELKENFKISDFAKAQTEVKLSAGSSKIALNEIKTIEEGDIILLENSNVNKMAVLWDEHKAEFNVNPNPSLIISVDSNGGSEMENGENSKPQNMWDSILVDIVAEFDNVKLTLGELKEISEGLVIDLGSVYENKVKLRVENQVVASGELVIINDRYGVRVDKVAQMKKSDAEPEIQPDKSKQEKMTDKTDKKQAAPKKAAPHEAADNAADGDENFDYSDFEIEDESI